MGKKWWLVTFLLLTILLGENLWFFRFQDNAQIVAKVGNEEITETAWIKELKERNGKKVLEEMINQSLIKEEANRLGIKIKESDILRELELLKTGYDSDDEFYEFVRDQMGLTEKQLKEQIEFYLLWEEVAVHDVLVTEEEMLNYYEEHMEQFTKPTELHLYQIIVEKEEVARKIKEEIAQGSDFTALAEEYSIDVLTNEKGGDLGFVSVDSPLIDENVKKILAGIRLNQVSEIIPVQEGYAIIKATEKKGGIVDSFEVVKSEIRREIWLQRSPSLLEVLEQLKQRYNVQIMP